MDINELFEKARAGDAEAEERLFHHLSVNFRHFIHLKDVDEFDADDVVQTALERIHRVYRQAEIHTNFAGWAYTVFKNALLEYFRNRGRRQSRSTAMNEQTTDGSSRPDELQVARRLEQCMRRLHRSNPTYARVLNLHYHGFSTSEICERLGVSKNNLYVMLSRARAMLRACLDE